MTRWLLAGLLALPLAACNDDVGNVQFSLNGMDGDGNSASLSLDLPGFKGNIKLPDAKIGGKDFDLNGVKLYPGSTIKHLNVSINALAGNSSGDEKGDVDVRFTSPATPDKVHGYFKDKLTAAGFTLHDAGMGLTGTTDDGKPVTIDLAPAGADSTDGTIHITG